MSSSERLARVLRKSIPWCVISFWANIWVNPSLRNICHISSTKISNGLAGAGAWKLSTPQKTPFNFLSLLIGSIWNLLVTVNIAVITTCMSLVAITPMWKSQDLCLWPFMASILSNSYEKRVQPVVFLATQRVLWSMVFFLLFWTTQQHALSSMQFSHCLLLVKMQFLAESLLSLPLTMTRVSRSDKPLNSSQIYRIKWIMAMSQWLNLCKCHHIQLNC